MATDTDKNGLDPEKWKLKHKLIVQQIKEKHDFSLEKINRIIEERDSNGKNNDIH
nr:MAG TPA: hypothetical protein [Caudoviricetes sp.]